MPDPGHIPGPVYIPNCLAVRLHWTLANGKTAYNVLHAHYSSPPTFSQVIVNGLFTDILTAFTASGLPSRLDNDTRLAAAGFRDMRQDPGGFGFGEWVSNNAGANGTGGSETAMPPQVSFVVSLKTGRSGQANRGRVYLPGFSTAAGEGNGRATVATATDCVDFIVAVQGALNASGYDLCIAHPARAAYTGSTGSEHPARPAGTVTVTSISYLDLVWDTQRLRSQI